MLVTVTLSPYASRAAIRRPGVEGGLRGEVGGELRRLELHAPGHDVDDLPEPLRPHRRQQPQGEPHRREEVDGHRALDVVEPVVAEVQRPADRAAGVVDEESTAPCSASTWSTRASTASRRSGRRGTPPRDRRGPDLAASRRAASPRRATSSTVRAARGGRQRGGLPMPDEAPVIRTRPPTAASARCRRGAAQPSPRVWRVAGSRVSSARSAASMRSRTTSIGRIRPLTTGEPSGANRAVGMPMSSASLLTAAPPELPGAMRASVSISDRSPRSLAVEEGGDHAGGDRDPRRLRDAREPEHGDVVAGAQLVGVAERHHRQVEVGGVDGVAGARRRRS